MRFIQTVLADFRFWVFLSLLFTSPAAAGTNEGKRLTLWGRDLIIAPQDRVLLKVDGQVYLLPAQLDQVLQDIKAGQATLVYGASGDLAQMRQPQFFAYHHREGGEPLTACYHQNQFIHKNEVFAAETLAYLENCMVVALSIGPDMVPQGVFVGQEVLRVERLRSQPPKHPYGFKNWETQELSRDAMLKHVLPFGEPADGHFFAFYGGAAGNFVYGLVPFEGSIYGPSPLFIDCATTLSGISVYGTTCVVTGYQPEAWVRARVKLPCPCKHDIENLRIIDATLSDRLRFFLSAETTE